MTEIWDTWYCRCSPLFSLKSHFLSQFPLKQPFSSEMLLAPRMKCLSLWHGIGEHLVTSKERLSAAAKQPVDDSGNCWTKSVCRKKSDEKGFVQWTPIAYLFFLNESCSGFCFFSCNSPGFDSKKTVANVTEPTKKISQLKAQNLFEFFWVDFHGFPTLASWCLANRILRYSTDPRLGSSVQVAARTLEATRATRPQRCILPKKT